MTTLGRTKVVLVMKKPGNLRVMEQALVRAGVLAMGVSSEDDLESLFETAFEPDLALVDVSDFGPAAWALCATLQARKLPFIVLSQPQDIETGSRSLMYGAMSILQKPVAKSALVQLIHSLAIKV